MVNGDFCTSIRLPRRRRVKESVFDNACPPLAFDGMSHALQRHLARMVRKLACVFTCDRDAFLRHILTYRPPLAACFRRQANNNPAPNKSAANLWPCARERERLVSCLAKIRRVFESFF